MKIVLVGDFLPDEIVVGDGIDLNLCGKTNLSEISCLLKHSLLHIGTEGGLIHLNHALGGKSCCLFGATSMDIFAYNENINLRSNMHEKCKNGCELLIMLDSGWRCLYDYEDPPCMQNLNPQYAYESMSEYLNTACIPKFSLSRIIERSELSSIFSPDLDCALICREGDNEVLSQLDGLKSLTVFDLDLSESPINPNASINLKYADRLITVGASAEYGTISNIPSKAERFDLIINFTVPNTGFPEYALEELIRITKSSGTVAVLNAEGKINLYQND